MARVEAVILDFWHAAQHVAAWAPALQAADAGAAERLQGEWCHRLKHEGGAAVRAALEGLDDGGWSAGQREAHRELVGYVRNQAHRMDSPSYLAKGWPIGSGPVEAACKLVGQRLKGAGMRWGEAGADAVCHLRALYRSEASPWDAFWRVSRAA